MRKIILRLTAALGIWILFASCVSTGSPAEGDKDDKAVARGVKAWNEKSPASAGTYWKDIRDEPLKKKYLSYVSAYEAGAKELENALALKPGETSRISAAYERAYRRLSVLPGELSVPEKDRARARPMAETAMREKMDAGDYSSAKTLGANAGKVFGNTENLRAMAAECDVILASRKREASADGVLERARFEESFDDRISGYETAQDSYAKAQDSLAADAGKAGLAKARSVAAESARLRKKSQDARIEREKALRERAYYYRDRIGEEFARQPEGRTPGSLSLQELLEHQESVKAEVQKVYDEMRDFSAKHPGALDAETLEDFDAQKRDLDAKIAQVQAEIRTAKEIESRGRVVMPVMIGLFNPQPGSAEEGKKSRPALFSAKGQAKPEYWWGMVSIPKGAMNDLVITVSDPRTVRVFGYNTKSGRLVDSKKIVDMVNRGYRVGNSWPVLNAGSQLVSDKYFFEIQPGKTPEYSGEVVVYSSFITRMR